MKTIEIVKTLTKWLIILILLGFLIGGSLWVINL